MSFCAYGKGITGQRIEGKPLGTGLGLSIVKSILESHGAAYGAASDKGGTVFWFETLPGLEQY